MAGVGVLFAWGSSSILGGVGVGNGSFGGMGGDPKTGEFCDSVTLAAATAFAEFTRLWVVSKGWRGWTFVPNLAWRNPSTAYCDCATRVSGPKLHSKNPT